MSVTNPISKYSEQLKILNTGDLRVGDIIFNVRNFHHQFAGHVSICIQPDADPKNVRVVHSTDNRSYYSLCISKLNPHTKPLRTGNHYEIIRCNDINLMRRTLDVLVHWTKFYMVFDDEGATVVEDEERLNFDSIFSDIFMLKHQKHERLSCHEVVSSQKTSDECEIKIQAQAQEIAKKQDDLNKAIDHKINLKLKQLFDTFHQTSYHKEELTEFHARRRYSPIIEPRKFPKELQKGFFCSSVILLALQVALLPESPRACGSDLAALPPEFQIPMTLCSPSMLLNALLKSGRFTRCGELQNDYILTDIDELKINQEKNQLLYRMFLNIARMKRQPSCRLRDSETRLVHREITHGFKNYVKCNPLFSLLCTIQNSCIRTLKTP